MSQRYEREIDEILRKFDGQLSSPPRRIDQPVNRRRSGLARGRATQALWSLYSLRWRWGADQVMLAGYALALAGFLLIRIFPFLLVPLGWTVVVLLTGGYLAGYRRGVSRPERRWRGQPMRYDQPRLSVWWENLRRRWPRR